MSIGWGISDPLWQAKVIVSQANPLYLKKAVIEVIDHLDQAGESGTSPFEVIDRIVQVIAVGKYTPPEPEEVFTKVYDLHDGKLSPEDEEEIRKLIDEADRILGGDAMDDKSFEDFLKEREAPDDDVE